MCMLLFTVSWKIFRCKSHGDCTAALPRGKTTHLMEYDPDSIGIPVLMSLLSTILPNPNKSKSITYAKARCNAAVGTHVHWLFLAPNYLSI